MTEPSSRLTQCAIGVDVGGTKCAAGLADVADGQVIARRVQPTEPQRGGEAILADVVELARSLQQEANRLNLRPVAVGVGVAELIGLDGEVLSEATIPWKGLHVARRIQSATGLQIVVDADVRAAARGEARFGAGRGYRSFLFVTVGTGISASLVFDGVPYAGERGLTGTFASGRGLLPGDDGRLIAGPPLEAFAAGPALAARLRVEDLRFRGEAPEVLALAEAGDAVAKILVIDAGRALGAAIAQLVNVVDPAAIVIGGGLGLALGMYRESLTAAIREYVWSEMHRELPILSAQLGANAGIVGAALGAVEFRKR